MSQLTKADFLSKIQEIGTCEDDVQRRSLLADIQTGVSDIFDTVDTLTEQNEQFTADNEALRSANMDLFKQIGVKEKPEDTPPPEPEPPKRTYENLFNEKGELK